VKNKSAVVMGIYSAIELYNFFVHVNLRFGFDAPGRGQALAGGG
jgi:hypothetical protein